jgi:site-specific DNA recombinase
MKEYFAYIRVSTTRQGESGVSLAQQRDAIERYAQRSKLEISRWFEEQETAAKQGRPIFGAMVRQLRKGVVAGVIIHKIDRSARNLRDWADLGQLIDQGSEIHFANESLDLQSRGGRLSADIQAVVAADYIRNLREESKKGFYGRLKQGYFPMRAPLGYLDQGGGQAKIPDPRLAPFVREAFDLYGTARFDLRKLSAELFRRGLRRANGLPYPVTQLSKMLNNPFYYGLIRIKKNGQCFAGVHQPLVSKALFERVQDVLQGKLTARTKRNDFVFRRRLKCKACKYSLIGETAKTFTYYRCHSVSCAGTCLREEVVEQAVVDQLAKLHFHPEERRCLGSLLKEMRGNTAGQRQELLTSLKLQLSQVADRLDRLTDAYIDRLIDQEVFEARKKTLLSERLGIEAKILSWSDETRDPSAELAKFLERADGALLAYKNASPEEKRDLLDSLTSNCSIDGKFPTIVLSFPFQVIADRPRIADGRARRDGHRTAKRLFNNLLAFVKTEIAGSEAKAA